MARLGLLGAGFPEPPGTFTYSEVWRGTGGGVAAGIAALADAPGEGQVCGYVCAGTNNGWVQAGIVGKEGGYALYAEKWSGSNWEWLEQAAAIQVDEQHSFQILRIGNLWVAHIDGARVMAVQIPAGSPLFATVEHWNDAPGGFVFRDVQVMTGGSWRQVVSTKRAW